MTNMICNVTLSNGTFSSPIFLEVHHLHEFYVSAGFSGCALGVCVSQSRADDDVSLGSKERQRRGALSTVDERHAGRGTVRISIGRRDHIAIRA
jgi:hypothetical protein